MLVISFILLGAVLRFGIKSKRAIGNVMGIGAGALISAIAYELL